MRRILIVEFCLLAGAIALLPWGIYYRAGGARQHQSARALLRQAEAAQADTRKIQAEARARLDEASHLHATAITNASGYFDLGVVTAQALLLARPEVNPTEVLAGCRRFWSGTFDELEKSNPGISNLVVQKQVFFVAALPISASVQTNFAALPISPSALTNSVPAEVEDDPEL